MLFQPPAPPPAAHASPGAPRIEVERDRQHVGTVTRRQRSEHSGAGRRFDRPLRLEVEREGAGPPDELQAGELADWLRRSIAELPDQQATVFVMRHFEQLSRDEMSAALGVSPEAISTALYKARQRLLAQLAVFNQGDLK